MDIEIEVTVVITQKSIFNLPVAKWHDKCDYHIRLFKTSTDQILDKLSGEFGHYLGFAIPDGEDEILQFMANSIAYRQNSDDVFTNNSIASGVYSDGQHCECRIVTAVFDEVSKQEVLKYYYSNNSKVLLTHE